MKKKNSRLFFCRIIFVHHAPLPLPASAGEHAPATHGGVGGKDPNKTTAKTLLIFALPL